MKDKNLEQSYPNPHERLKIIRQQMQEGKEDLKATPEKSIGRPAHVSAQVPAPVQAQAPAPAPAPVRPAAQPTVNTLPPQDSRAYASSQHHAPPSQASRAYSSSTQHNDRPQQVRPHTPPTPPLPGPPSASQMTREEQLREAREFLNSATRGSTKSRKGKPRRQEESKHPPASSRSTPPKPVEVKRTRTKQRERERERDSPSPGPRRIVVADTGIWAHQKLTEEPCWDLGSKWARRSSVAPTVTSIEERREGASTGVWAGQELTEQLPRWDGASKWARETTTVLPTTSEQVKATEQPPVPARDPVQDTEETKTLPTTTTTSSSSKPAKFIALELRALRKLPKKKETTKSDSSVDTVYSEPLSFLSDMDRHLKKLQLVDGITVHVREIHP